jgi:nucleotide-binding universal stress UspA family protein
MKRFLVPTDFSDIAGNTLDYATELANYSFAELILFHASYQPVLATDLTVTQPFFDELEEDCKRNLEELKQKVLKKHPDLRVSCEYRLGLPAETIHEFIHEHPVDLIVIGTQGTGYLTERFMGSIATSLARKAECPVLIIDRQVRFRQPDKIVLAADYKERINGKILRPLQHLMANFDAHLYILHIVPEDQEINADERIQQEELAHAFRYSDHSVISLQDDTIIEGINDFVTAHDAGMVVMIPREQTFFERIFREPFVKQMAFHSKVPLLVLHH